MADLSNKAKYEILKQETQARFPYLIHIYNADYGDFYYANYSEDLTYGDITYKAGYFSITPPQKTTSSISNATLEMSAVDQTWIEMIRNTDKQSTCEFVASIVYDKDDTVNVEAMEKYTFTLKKATWTDTTISWEMTFDDNMNIVVPVDTGNALNTAGVA